MKTKNLVIILFLLITLTGGLVFFLTNKKKQPVASESALAETRADKVTMIISGASYETEAKTGSSVYDLMNTLREQKKIDFKSVDYSGLGFFVTEINGVKNDPSGKNWLYYVNGQPAQVGVTYYLVKANDVIEWKYEKKSF
jgi:hypothetical protein